MRLQHTIEQVYLKPQLMTATAHAAVRAVIESKLGRDSVSSFSAEDMEEVDIFGEPLPTSYDLDAHTRVIPVYGIIGHKVSMLEKTCGVCDVRDIKNEIALAINNSEIATIILDIDSPGGVVNGVPELADYIKEQSKWKSIVSYIDNQCASAAYWLASATDEIYTTTSAEVGSIGCYSYMIDVSRMYEAEGAKVELFTSGRYKGMGLPGLPLTAEQKELLQSEVDMIAGVFKDFVKKCRPKAEPESMEGQMFMGTTAIDKGLSDAIAEDISHISTTT